MSEPCRLVSVANFQDKGNAGNTIGDVSEQRLDIVMVPMLMSITVVDRQCTDPVTLATPK